MSTTAADLINGALRLIGQLAEGEEPSPETSQDSLRAFTAMIESWDNEPLMIYTDQMETFTLPASVASRTIGVGGNFNTTWPLTVLASTFTRNAANAPGIDFPVTIINQAQYNSIQDKSTTGPYPEYIYYDRAYPLGTLYFWPVMTTAVELHLATWTPLQTISGLTTVIALPRGYDRALRFNLAVELAGEFGVEASPSVKTIAAKAKENLRRTNGQNDVMDLPLALPGQGRAWNYFSFYSGGTG